MTSSISRLMLFPGSLFLLVVCLRAAGQSDGGSLYQFHQVDNAWVSNMVNGLSLRDKIAQLIQVRVPGKFMNRSSAEFIQIQKEIRDNHVGGLVLFAGNVYESAVLLNELQELSSLPLLVAADFERGASFRVADTTSFPWTMAIGATGSEDFAYAEGAITAREARALGVHWIFAPVMDVNNNPENPVINIRSYGEDPHLVARLGAAFIRGAHDNAVLTTAKHFPGHGDTSSDSHIGLPVVAADRERLNAVELVPFRSALAAGVDSVMTAHVAMPQLTGNPELPATLSPQVLTDMLRGALQFTGLVITDALEMGAVTGRYWSGAVAVKALMAGADVLLLPTDTTVAINEVERAVRRGDIPEKRINESVARILTAKAKLGLQSLRTVPLERIDEVVTAPDSQKAAQEMADRSITLVRNEGHLVPLNPLDGKRVFSLVLSADPDSAPGALFQTEMRRRFTNLKTAAMDTRTPEEEVAAIIKSAADADIIVCATLVRVITGKGSIGLPENERALMERIVANGKPLVWVALGSPYVLRSFPQVGTYLCTFSHSDVSQSAAAKALSGEIGISGKMPVSIPQFSNLGDGIIVPKREMKLTYKSAKDVGLSENAFDETKRLLEKFVAAKAFPGAALVVGYGGSVVLDTAAGRLDYNNTSAKVSGDTIYDLASVSKVVATATAAMMLVESGRLLLQAPVQEYLPEFVGQNKDKVRIIHLLTHTSGLPPFVPLYKEATGYDEVLKKVCSIPLEFEPGTRNQYSDLGMILLGEIISRAAGESLDRFVGRRLFEPLGMQSTGYHPPASLLDRIAPTENDPWRKRVIRGEVHDENAYALGGVAGHAGLFSSAHDLAIFSQLLLNRGMYDYRRYFSPDTLTRFTSQNGTAEGHRAFGWIKPSASDWTGEVFSGAAYGHSGFTGTSLWIDPAKQLFIILLSNRVHPSRENAKITKARQGITESIIRAINSR